MNIDTSTPEGFRQAREYLELTIPELARLLHTNERTVKRWENDPDRPVHPTAAVAMDWFLEGYRPDDWPIKLTGADLQNGRYAMGLSVEELATLLDADNETIEAWESDDRGPPPLVVIVFSWLFDRYLEGDLPDNWPAKDLTEEAAG